jgi:hypothetical protein
MGLRMRQLLATFCIASSLALGGSDAYQVSPSNPELLAAPKPLGACWGYDSCILLGVAGVMCEE